MTAFDAVARTSLLTAALRSRESAAANRLYDDPYAHLLCGREGHALLDRVQAATTRDDVCDDGRRVPDTVDYNAIRTRFLDDWLRAQVADSWYSQVVIAAAGMDTRAYRLDWPRPVTVYEIDRAPVLAHKAERLAGHTPRAERREVPADLVTDDWRAALTDAGFDPAEPAVWLFEGLFYYLPPVAAHRLIAQLAGFCAPDSRVAADVVNRDALDAPSTRALMSLYAEWGSPWLFGCDEPEAAFAAHGFAVAAVQPGEPGADYGRWTDDVTPRGVPGVPRVFYVHGRRT
ncbi:class I SAM-dependent methyltransferase [Actinokineospora soli]|uniref:S-adenosyl-L-methionine-dependent methyltransferase n=1 Tax=Actinokineospora soli TaxID=1048753 RepID=A0ABW2TW95_9PSEU